MFVRPVRPKFTFNRRGQDINYELSRNFSLILAVHKIDRPIISIIHLSLCPAAKQISMGQDNIYVDALPTGV